MSDDRAKDVIRTWERRKGDRGTTETVWQDLANNLLPNRSDYLSERTPGQKLMSYVYDSTPMWALESFAAGMHGTATSPSLQWFTNSCEDDRLNSMPDVSAWWDAANTAMYRRFNGTKHNFASQSFELYSDIGSIGTACMAVLDSPRVGTLFSCRHMKECVVAENEEDRIDQLTRQWKYTATQAFNVWGTNAGEGVLKALESKPDQQFTFLHEVKPRLARDPQRADRLHMAFSSSYVNLSDMTTIDVGGFQEFPYLVPRFAKRTGEIYGRGPGHTALPDVKMLYELKKIVVKAAQKIIDPPLMLPDDGYTLPINTTPGSKIYYRAGMQDRIEPLKTGGDIQVGSELLQSLQQSIIRNFYVEWMLMPSDPADPASAGKGVTATYTLQNRDEKMRLLSGLLARLQAEFLGPLIERTFALMWRESVRMNFGPGSPFPPPPDILRHKPWKTQYISPLAVAQKSAQLDTVMKLVSLQLQLMQADPATPRVLDGEGIMRLAARDLNSPTLALKTPQVLQQEQQAAQEAQAQLNGHAQMQSFAKSAKDGTAAIANLAQAGQNADQGAGDQQQAA